MQENIWNDQNLKKVLQEGGVVVMPTDTIYGIVGQALNQTTVLHIYSLKKRTPEKPCIILIGDISELKKFLIVLSDEQKKKLKEYWPGAVSIILDCPSDGLSYLHRGTKTLAFRLPESKELRKLLSQTGPLIVPSSNPEGLPPAQNIEEAKKYFGNSIDLYINGGDIMGKASKLIKLNRDGTVIILRN